MQNGKRWLVGATALAMSAQLVLAAPAGAAPGEGSRPEPTPTEEPGPANPLPVTCRPIDFEDAEVVRRQGSYQLVVTGTVPYWNMTVRLTPVTYIRQPEYWEIQVEGCVSGDVVLPAVREFTATLDLEGTMGTEGIQVGDETFDLPAATPDRPDRPERPERPTRPWWKHFWRR